MIARSLVMGMATTSGSYLPSHVPVPRALISHFSVSALSLLASRATCAGSAAAGEVILIKHRMKQVKRRADASVAGTLLDLAPGESMV